ncbi:hypothetical protein PDE_07878 [Penicillium oxalicum 114-2]|uniref:Uncharacterized protein n=1 Tax=Penicillium oxalicum (strain 114-2 / CGMCC 5302) TaxID=933388 RepID=S8BD80_PENO1|nr:hypothetical protein PDE_07878 [Penicillium oxalicum 114-2]
MLSINTTSPAYYGRAYRGLEQLKFKSIVVADPVCMSSTYETLAMDSWMLAHSAIRGVAPRETIVKAVPTMVGFDKHESLKIHMNYKVDIRDEKSAERAKVPAARQSS